MGSVHGCDDKHVKRIDNRVPVLVTDFDGDDAYVHCLALAPEGVTIKRAYDDVTDCLRRAIEEDEDEWSYEDVEALLVNKGYLCYPVAVWEETRDG